MPAAIKPPALEPGDTVRVIAPASPVEEDALHRGCAELEQLGYRPQWDPRVLARQGYFAGSAEERAAKFVAALEEQSSRAVFSARGGYGSGYLLDLISPRRLAAPKILVGYSDITLLQLFLWRKKRWASFYGPMVASGLDKGAGAPCGYDVTSLEQALTQTHHGWEVELHGETLFFGSAEGVVLGGCLTLVEATLGTPWEIETRGAVLLLEDVSMHPYQVDRALVHLRHAGKFEGVRGIVLGEFPKCETEPGKPSVREVCERILAPLKIPVVWGAPVGHTGRPMLTVPLGVRARLTAQQGGRLEILEPACSGARQTPMRSSTRTSKSRAKKGPRRS